MIKKAFASFVEKIGAGGEGVFFSERKGNQTRWIFGWGNKTESDFELGPFPFFSLTSFEGNKHSFWHFEHSISSDEILDKSFEQMCKTSAQNVFNFSSIQDTETEESFCSKIEEVRQLAKNGDVWVLNLAHSLSGELTNEEILLNVFRNFLALEKDHCGGVIWTNEQRMCSMSPEVFLRQEDSTLSTFPIKGTGTKEYLENNEKEIAELAMVTDLLRNDLGKIARRVWVEKKRVIVNRGEFSDAHAEIYAELPSSQLSWKQYQSLLPCGSISGAPKKRVVENVLKLEGFERGFYTGTFGVRFSPTDSVFNILIRTLFLHNKTWQFPVGAGITHKSIAVQEWAETLQKAEILKECENKK